MDPVIGLSLGRIAVGAVTLGNPELGAKLFQLDAKNNKHLPYMTRMFGSREIALGTWTLLARGVPWHQRAADRAGSPRGVGGRGVAPGRPEGTEARQKRVAGCRCHRLASPA